MFSLDVQSMFRYKFRAHTDLLLRVLEPPCTTGGAEADVLYYTPGKTVTDPDRLTIKIPAGKVLMLRFIYGLRV